MVANSVDLERNDFLMEFMGSKGVFWLSTVEKEVGEDGGERLCRFYGFWNELIFLTFNVHMKPNRVKVAKGIQVKS